MNSNRDRLDEAIDQVTAHMTHVNDDPVLVARIVVSLPERVGWFGWLCHAWVPRLAMIAIVVTAGLLWSRRETAVTPTQAPVAAVSPATPIARPSPLVVENVAPNRTNPLEPLEHVEPVEPSRSDFERSLSAIAAMKALELEVLTPLSLPEDAALTLKPLAVESLTLIDDGVSPLRQEL